MRCEKSKRGTKVWMNDEFLYIALNHFIRRPSSVEVDSISCRFRYNENNNIIINTKIIIHCNARTLKTKQLTRKIPYCAVFELRQLLTEWNKINESVYWAHWLYYIEPMHVKWMNEIVSDVFKWWQLWLAPLCSKWAFIYTWWYSIFLMRQLGYSKIQNKWYNAWRDFSTEGVRRFHFGMIKKTIQK